MKDKNYLIIILFIILCLVVFITNYEGLTNPPSVKNSVARQDGTCSDPDQTNIYDRFDGLAFANMSASVSERCRKAEETYDMPYEYIARYFNMENICLPRCMDGYIVNPNDSTLCIASNSICYNTADLSSNILDSWRDTCGTIKKTQLNLTSTINSISNVKQLVNSNTNTIYTMVYSLSNRVFNPSAATTAEAITLRNLRYPYLLSNYMDAYTINSNIDFNYTSLRTKKTNFDTIYNSFLCDEYS